MEPNTTDDAKVMQKDGEPVDNQPDGGDNQQTPDSKIDEVQKWKAIAERKSRQLDELIQNSGDQSDPEPKSTPDPKQDFDESLLDSKLEAKLRERDLAGLDINDDLRKEVKQFAELNNVSIQDAFKSDYIQFKKDKFDQAAREEAASVSNSGDEGGGITSIDFSNVDLSDPMFDQSTEEGRANFEKYKQHLKS